MFSAAVNSCCQFCCVHSHFMKTHKIFLKHVFYLILFCTNSWVVFTVVSILSYLLLVLLNKKKLKTRMYDNISRCVFSYFVRFNFKARANVVYLLCLIFIENRNTTWQNKSIFCQSGFNAPLFVVLLCLFHLFYSAISYRFLVCRATGFATQL